MSHYGCGLLIVDMQNDIVGGHDDASLRSGIERINRLASWARGEEVPVIYTCVAYRDPGRDAPPNTRARTSGILREGNPGSAVIADLAPTANDSIVIKRRVGAFYGTDLEILLRSLDVTRLLITGSSTPRAVESTAREAHSRDIPTVVVSDAVLCASSTMHHNSLEVIGRWFADVMITDEAISFVSSNNQPAVNRSPRVVRTG